jgi:hypothetical protein
MSDELPRLYTTEEVAKALSVVADVTLDRVLAGLEDHTYGSTISRDKDDNPKIKMIIDWKDVRKTIEGLRQEREE